MMLPLSPQSLLTRLELVSADGFWGERGKN
jgi:hypothetical protein